MPQQPLPICHLSFSRRSPRADPGLAIPSEPDNNTPQPLPFSFNLTDSGLIATNDNWSGVPGIEGYFLRNDGVFTTGVDPRTILGDTFGAGTTSVELDVTANQPTEASNTATFGGVAEFHADAQGNPFNFPIVALQPDNVADAPFLIINVNTSGRTNISAGYVAYDIDCSSDNAVQLVATQFRVGNTGNFTNIPGEFVHDVTSGPELCNLTSFMGGNLPATANNQPLVQIRIITANADGPDEWVGIDFIDITGTAVGGSPTPTITPPAPTPTPTPTPSPSPSPSPSPYVGGKTFVVPHVHETTGSVATTQFTYDTTFVVTYAGGIGNNDVAPGASVDLFIFDDLTGQPLRSLTNLDVCNPCSFTVNQANRKAIGNVEGIANSVGGLPRQNVTGSMLLIAAGDVEEMAVAAHIVNSHTGPQDLSTLSLSVCDSADFLPSQECGGPDIAPGTVTAADIIYFREDSLLPNHPFSFSTYLHAYYAGGLPGTTAGTGATVQLRLYDDLTGQPLLSITNQPVCAPCTVDLTTTSREHDFSVDALVRAAGGFPRADVQGFATVQVVGDAANVSFDDTVTNVHSSASDVEMSSTTGTPFEEMSQDSHVRTFVLTHLLEKSGTILNTTFTFDTTIYATYTGGLTGLPPGNGATVDLFLFDEATGQTMMNQGQPVCGPCSYTLTPSNRKQSIRIDDLITRNGTVQFDTALKLGFGVIVVGGQDPDGVNLQGFVVNSHTSQFDLSVFGFEPQPILGESGTPFGKHTGGNAQRPGGLSEGSRRILSAEYDYPHFRDRTGKASNTTFTFDSEFHAAYNGATTANLELYLYDQMTSMPLMSLTNQPVCNPCNLPLNTTTRKRRIIVDDLITAAGGFPRLDVAGFARIKVTGDAGRVAILGMLINAHSGPNDLSTSELRVRHRVRRTTDFDFNGDGRADIGVFRPNDPAGSMFYLLQTGSDQFNAFRWGLPTDKPVTEDYDGDGKTDIAVWRPPVGEEHNLFIFSSQTSTVRTEHFGVSGDDPQLTADFDGDGKTDPAVYREGSTPGAQSYFYYRPSRILGVDFRAMPWGINGDRPLRGDYDGDGKADITVFRPTNQIWYILQSSTGSLRAESWGLATDRFVPEDYDGDGRTDLAVFRDGVWHIKRSREDLYEALFWGLVNDLPVPGDFDGDGRTDVAVFRDGLWYIRHSNGQTRIANFGQAGDRPLPLFQ